MTPEVIGEDANLRDAVAAIERGRKTIAIMVDSAGLMVGTITDGDIRRAILRGLSVEAPARNAVNRTPIAINDGTTTEETARILAEHNIEAAPVIDERGRFLRTVFIENLTYLQGQPSSVAGFWAAIIMAGGEGRRLRPHTEALPKPMLAIGGMPLMERNIRTLVQLGIPRFFLAIHYLGHLIEQHFRDGESLGARIDYLREDEPLGTGGAIRLIGERPQGPVLLMNGDVLTGLDVGRLLAFHRENGAYITVAAKEHLVEVPFGVLRVNDARIQGLTEKPSERFLCNAGIYVLAPEVFDSLPTALQFDMTTLIEHALAGGRRVIAFPMFELWKDIGTPQQLDEARKLIELGEISDA